MARIALAEDDPDIRTVVSLTLKVLGHEVTAFEDGAAALLGLGESRFDLLISDVMMPRLDGISLCRAVRARADSRGMPIVLLSALSREEEILEGYEAGADQYIVKPFATAMLRAKLRHVLQQAAHGRDRKPAATLPDLVPGAHVGLPARYARYELRELIGEGGYSTVYGGHDESGRPVALKLFEGDMVDDRAALGRYFREVTVLQDVRSPGIVRVLDSGFAQGRFYIVMERVPGRSAGEILFEDGVFDAARASSLGRDAARALCDLTTHGLVHRDIKPANVMVRPNGQCVLIDFGLTKGEEDAAITHSSELIGTAPFLAPELILGSNDQDMASDLYALGVSVYQLLTAEFPFEGEGYALLKNVVSGRSVPRLDTVRADLPAALVSLVEELMRPDPELRLRDPLEVAERFDALARGAGGTHSG